MFFFHDESHQHQQEKQYGPINNRLQRLESKLDSKPGFPQTLGIGVLSGIIVHVIPQVVSSIAHIWNSVQVGSWIMWQ